MKNHSIKVQGNEKAIQAALTQVQIVDKAAEKGAKVGCLIVGLGILIGILGVNATVLGPGALILLALSGMCLVYGIVKYSRSNSRNIEDARYEQLMRLHKFLALDCDNDAELTYEVNLRAYDDPVYFLRKEKFGTGMFALPRGDISYYQMPFLTSRVLLRDGTTLAIQVDRATAKKTVTKRGVSGKTKTKSKLKYRDIYSVRIKVPEGMSHPPASLDEWRLKAQLKPDYKAAGPKARAVSVRKGIYDRVPDLDSLFKLLCVVFFSLHYERHRTA